MKVELDWPCDDAPMGRVEIVPETAFEKRWLRHAMTDARNQCVWTVAVNGSRDGAFALERRPMPERIDDADA
jgi:hypothetical protein